MKSLKRITCLLIILLIFSACSREAYPVKEPTNTTPVIETANPVVSEPAPPPVIAEINPQAATVDWETLYIQDNPVTDLQELIRILEDLKERFMNQFDKLGWYQLKWHDVQTNWIHVSDPGSGRFDGILNYYESSKYPEGFMRPWDFLSLDGHYGRMHSNATLDDFYFVPLETQPPETVWENLDFYLSCDFCVASEHMDYLIQWIRDPAHTTPDSKKDTIFMGWVGRHDNQLVFIFNANVTFHTNMPVTNDGEKILIEDTSYYISLDNGGTIAEHENNVYLSGNTSTGVPLLFNLHLITHFETMPERVQILYDECYKKLIEFEGKP